jgi:hypothetical protein
MLGRLLAVRLVVPLAMLLALSLPGLLRLLAAIRWRRWRRWW